MPNNVFRVTLTTLSPIFIKSIDTGEFHIGEKYYYKINQEKFLDFIRLKYPNELKMFIKNICDYMEKIDDINTANRYNAQRINIFTSIIQAKRLVHNEIVAISDYYCPIGTIPGGNKNEVSTIVKTGFHKPYIPGSSIKGAIRTAISVGLFENAIKNKYKEEKQYNIKKASAVALESSFQSLNLSNAKGAQNDILRQLLISDTTTIEPEKLILSDIELYKYNYENMTVEIQEQIVARAEVIPEHTVFHFDLKLIDIQNNGIKESIPNQLKNLKEIINTYYRAKLKEEQQTDRVIHDKYIQENYYQSMNLFDGNILIKIGSGTGKSVIMPFHTECDAVEKKDRKGNPVTYIRDKPKTAKYGEGIPLGWCKLEFTEKKEEKR